MRKSIALSAGLLIVLNGTAFSETIGYGSRAGMEVTVLSKTGIGTEAAIIQTKHTKENAISFCREYVEKITDRCIEEELSVRLKPNISANCQTGAFTDFFGAKFKFIGKNSGGDPEFAILDKSGQKLDGSSASGYPTNLEIYKALCPIRASTVNGSATLKISDFYGIWSSIEDKCQSYKENTDGPWFDIERNAYGPGNSDESCGKAQMKLSGNALTITTLCGSMEDESSKPSKRTFVYKLVNDRVTSSDGSEVYERCKKIPR